MAIYFYKTNDQYGYLSNFAPYCFWLDGKFWATSEHYFQAHKFYDSEYAEKVRLSNSPMEAAKLGRNRGMILRSDWEEIKDDIMRKAVYAKFSQNIELKLLLLGTGNETIIEKTTDDYYWGCGKDYSGKNMLGRILMEIREILKSESNIL